MYTFHRLVVTEKTNGLEVSKTMYEYDAFSNPIKEETIPYAQAVMATSVTSKYSTNGRLLDYTINELGLKTSYRYLPNSHLLVTSSDHNGDTMFDYDALGRVIEISYPVGPTENTAFNWGEKGLYTVTFTVTGKPATIVHYDALGREISTGTQRFDGTWLYVDKAYNSRGLLEKVSLPYKGSTPSYWNNYSYDSYNRPTLYAEASEKNTVWGYDGLKVSETRNGITSTKTFDASGALVGVVDPGGTISYTLRADGQPSSITAPGNVVTSFGYDNYGRQTSISDPSAGTQTFSDEYTGDGKLKRMAKDANGKIVTSFYDKFGRIKNVERPEFNTEYFYNTYGLLTGETSTNGTSQAFTYDTYSRLLTAKETIPDGNYLEKKYSYVRHAGNVESIVYTSQNGEIGTENFIYNYGHNTEIKLNNQASIWKLTEENALGQPTKATTGTLERRYGYTPYGMPEYRKVYKTQADTIQSFTYKFDVAKGNLDYRKDNKRNITETFGYDNLNRLTNAAGKTINYSPNGNITSIAGVGAMAYENTGKPYQVSMLTPNGNAVPVREQAVTYTSFQRPNSIEENGIKATFAYNAAGDRVKMLLTQGSTAVLTRHYIGGQYEMDKESGTERLYLSGDAYSAPAVYVKDAGVWKMYYICRDYLGNITHIANDNGSLKDEYSYDAWGRLRNPATQVAYTPGTEPSLFLGRGYTGHEHLPWFGLVNMNARLYDAALGRFLSPDPYVQMPDFSQNFNRYSYALNNPLVYIDEDGEWVWIVFIVVNGAINVIDNWDDIKASYQENGWKGVGKGLGYFATGAGAGTATYFLGGFGTVIGEYGKAGLNSLIAEGNFSRFNGQEVLRGIILDFGISKLGIGSYLGKAASNGMDFMFGEKLLNNLAGEIVESNVDGLLKSIGEATWESGDLQIGLDQGWNKFKGEWLNHTVMGVGEGVLRTYDFGRTIPREANAEAAQAYYKQHRTMKGFESPFQPDIWSEHLYNWQMKLDIKMNESIFIPSGTYIRNLPKSLVPSLYPGLKP